MDMAGGGERPMALTVTYHGEERQTRTFEILVDGSRVGEQTIERHRPGSPTKTFFDVEYAIPADLTRGKQKVTVRFQATGGNETATVFGIRTIRADRAPSPIHLTRLQIELLTTKSERVRKKRK